MYGGWFLGSVDVGDEVVLQLLNSSSFRYRTGSKYQNIWTISTDAQNENATISGIS